VNLINFNTEPGADRGPRAGSPRGWWMRPMLALKFSSNAFLTEFNRCQSLVIALIECPQPSHPPTHAVPRGTRSRSGSVLSATSPVINIALVLTRPV